MTGLPLSLPLPSSPPFPRSFRLFLLLILASSARGGLGNRMLRTASLRPPSRPRAARFAQVAGASTEWQPDALVIGVPYHPDGANHETRSVP